MATPDHWHCEACGADADLAPLSVELGLVRLAVDGAAGFRLGSAGIEPQLADLLEGCACGGRLVPGPGSADTTVARFDRGRLRATAERGWQRLEQAPALDELREVWRPRALTLIGRESELRKEDVLRLRLEDKLAALQAEVERATSAGDDEAAETAHARYIELGTTYVRRFVRPDEPAASSP
ncbi:MAG: hypothetical protein QOG33_1569 [Gaiellales bacterium]|nr:hypothetical protein [Gaiellales bacterium]